MSNSENSYCEQLVKENDPDRFLLSHFVKPDRREALWALFAFNYEVAKTREVVSETQLGLIRLQWWRDAIAAIYEDGAVPEHEIIISLQRVIKAYDLPRDLFDTLIYAREFDLEDMLPGNLEGVLHYADFTSTPLMKLAVIISGGDAEVEPVQPIATNFALMGIVRSVPFFASQRRCLLPEDLMKEYEVRQDKLYEFKPQENLSNVVKAVAEQFVEGVISQNSYLRVSQRLSKLYLSQIRKCGFDVFHPRMQIRPAFKELRLLLDL